MSRSRYLASHAAGRSATLASTAALVLLIAAPAVAAWSPGGTGAAAGAATTMPGGNSPAVAGSGRDVSVRWAVVSFPSGAAVEGYVVQRYAAAAGEAATVGAACAGIVKATTCTESNVPPGTWVYT